MFRRQSRQSSVLRGYLASQTFQLLPILLYLPELGHVHLGLEHDEDWCSEDPI
jgi:hypothetical protein